MASRNPFALLAEDGDASDNEQKSLPKQSKPVAVDAAPKNGKPARGGAVPAATTRRSVPGQTTVRPQREANELPASDAPAGDRAQFDGERGRDDRGTGFQRGRGRGARGGERGRGRGGRGGAVRPDRRSQTGRVDSEKAEHQGWGGDDGKRELEAETDGVADAAAEKTGDAPATPAAADGETADAAAAAAPASADADKAPEASAEPEDNSKTYEEFLKEQRAAGRGVLDSLTVQARKANEGSDDSQWKDGKLVKKGEADETLFGDLLKEKSSKGKKERKEKTFLEVEFSAPARQGPQERRGGGRGGARGGRGRGEGAPRARGAAGPRGGRGRGGQAGQTNGINLSDNSAFPSLA